MKKPIIGYISRNEDSVHEDKLTHIVLYEEHKDLNPLKVIEYKEVERLKKEMFELRDLVLKMMLNNQISRHKSLDLVREKLDLALNSTESGDSSKYCSRCGEQLNSMNSSKQSDTSCLKCRKEMD